MSGEILTAMPFVWLGIIVVASLVEAATVQLVSVWFAVGGIAAVIASACGADILVQILLFIAVTVLALILTRPLVKKITHSQKAKTNADRYIGNNGVVTEEINNTAGQGEVKVMGSVWTARSEDGTVIPIGENIVVKRIEGVKAIVACTK
ncbi:MAG: NfeD family protein [Oscillospiraceae bacterium]|nr:NfeD family protein [Oscillospiraceae bacterium]